MKISKRVSQSYSADKISNFKFSKGNNSVKKCWWNYGTCSLVIV